MLGRGAGKDGTIALESVCLMSPHNGIREYDVDTVSYTHLIRIASAVYIRIAHVMKALRKKGMMNWLGSWRSDREKRLMDEENTERKRRK